MSEPSPAHATRRYLVEALLAGIVVAVVHVLFRLSAGFLVGALNDDGVYVVLGKAIAEGSGYRSLHLVGAPVQVRYPPGLPLLLAIPWAIGGSLGAVRATVAVLHPVVTAGAASLLWWYGRRRLALDGWPLAVCAIAPLLLDGTIQYFNLPLSEPYFVLGWATALVLAYPLLEPAPAGRTPVPRATLLGLVLAGTILFRSAAIPLVPAMLLALALRRRWAAVAACAAGAAALLVAWLLLRQWWLDRGPVSSYPDDLGYWRWLGVGGPLALAAHAGRSMIVSFAEYVPKFGAYLVGSLVVGVGLVAAAMVAAVIASVRLWRTQAALVLTVVAVGALTLVWPFVQGRLILPLLPFAGLLVAAGLAIGLRRTPARLAWVPRAALGLLVLAVTLRQFDQRQAAARAYLTGEMPTDLSPVTLLALRTPFIFSVSRWVRARTTPEDHIMVDAPASVYLYTGRQTVVAEPTESAIAASVFEVPGRYLAERILTDSVTVVVWHSAAPHLRTDIETVAARCPGVITLEDTAAAAVYFRVTRDARCLRERVLDAGRPGAAVPQPATHAETP